MAACDVLVVGSGAVGCYFGARLQQAGRSVKYLARGGNFAELRRNGIELTSVDGDLRLPKVDVEERYTTAEPASLVLVAVKAWQLPAAAELMLPALGPDTLVLPLCNGALSSASLGALLPDHRVLAGCCSIYVRRLAPGRIDHFDGVPMIQYGRLRENEPQPLDRVEAMFEACVGVDVEEPADIDVAIWRKFLFISAISSVGAAVREPLGRWRDHPDTRALCRQAMEEVVAVAQASGVDLQPRMVESALRWLDESPADAMSSLQRDVAAGRPSELAAQTGAVWRLGERLGVPTPAYRHLWAVLAPGERVRRAVHGEPDA